MRVVNGPMHAAHCAARAAGSNAGAAKQLEELRKQHESDQDRAIREAVENARTQVFAELGSERVADAFRVAAAGRGLDVDDVLVAEPLAAPDVLDDLGPRQCRARPGGKGGEDVELGASQ